MSDEHIYQILSSYNVPKLSYEPFTPYIKNKLQVTKSVKRENIHKFCLCLK